MRSDKCPITDFTECSVNVSTQYDDFKKNINWQFEIQNVNYFNGCPYKNLVLSEGSLTKSLIELCDDFSVNVLAQQTDIPFLHEQQLLNNDEQKQAVIRQVELVLKGQPVVYARSILPIELMENASSGLSNLGKNPLGHLLFKQGQIKSTQRQYAECKFKGEQSLSRRTPYQYLGSKVLVSEFFLPAIGNFLK